MADDNEVNVFVLTGFLRSWGVEPDVVTNGRQAVERIQERDYDLVLMDLTMPELDGYAATRQIRALADPRFQRLPIFAFSASVRMDPHHEVEAAGFTDFVGKPIGTGPFKFVEHARGDHLTAAANESFYLGKPLIDQVIYKVIPDVNTTVAQVRTGELDIAFIGTSHLDALKGAQNVRIDEANGAFTRSITPLGR